MKVIITRQMHTRIPSHKVYGIPRKLGLKTPAGITTGDNPRAARSITTIMQILQ
jgi:hypothetical protein